MITKIGKRRKLYPDPSTVEFYSLEEYLKISQKIIAHFANSISSGLANKMLRSEDAISHVAYHLMLAAWKWTPTGGRTLRSYLNQHGIWAIQDYVNKGRTKLNKKVTSLHSVVHQGVDYGTDIELIDFIADEKAVEPIDELLSIEDNKAVHDRLDKSGLTDNQKTCLIKFIDGMSYSEIAEELKVSRQNVQQIVQAAVRKCKASF